MILGTRASALALAQTRLTQAALAGVAKSAMREYQTTGDKRLDLSLAAAVGLEAAGKLDKGLFTKELENALLAGEIHAAVHSLKDLPTANPPGLVVAAVLPRAPVEDVLILSPRLTGLTAPAIFHSPSSIAPPTLAVSLRSALSVLPPGGIVATSSVRRRLQLLDHRPDLRAVEVRGNVGTRLEKLRASAEWSGMLLARAGLERLGFDLSPGFIEVRGERLPIVILPAETMLPAAGQGAIALQARADDSGTLAALKAVNHFPTFAAVTAERELLRLLGGGCQAPVGALGTVDDAGGLLLRTVVFPADGGPPRRAEARGEARHATAVARDAAARLGMLGDEENQGSRVA